MAWGVGNSASAREVAEVARLLRELQARVESLGAAAKTDASNVSSAIPDMLSEILGDLTGRVRQGARSVGGEASRVGHDALHKFEEEVGNRPLATIAVAAGIGFLLGIMNRR